jgi:RNA polymerase sigma-B factor
VTPCESSVDTEHGQYAHLVGLHHRYADFAVKDPERQQLREQLISGYLPVAKHIARRFARRFARRREPLEDLVQVATVGLINAVDRFEPTRGSISFPARYRLSSANYAGTSATTAGQRGFRAD